MSTSIVESSILYDPVGEAPIISKLVTFKPENMLNGYKRLFKVGGGQHGTVYLCTKKRKDGSTFAVVSFPLSLSLRVIS